MDALLQAFADYGWWIVGLVLLVLEVVVPGIYLVFFGLAALVVGTNAFLVGGSGWFGFPQQVIAFVVVAAVAIYLGRRWYGQAPGPEDAGPLNRRTGRLVGREARLTDAIVDGRGRIALEDSWWSVSGPDLPQGTRVRITGADGAVLTVEPAQ
ncbi:NfeD family protein [Jiella sonneratiae]|uniref:NfeD family protein n=1 Tax=Jiella sonneratiae TaxID=2816856 RepID=A0ABS3IZN6_9HYPH|nr:NfeD family protein [Jiella sonneratiae]MBO0902874.1 NfeD family protein [Jiella sonneratiae]